MMSIHYFGKSQDARCSSGNEKHRVMAMEIEMDP